MAIGVLGMGSYVPEQVTGNSTISAWSNAAEERASERTGTTERGYADAGTPTSALAVRAVERMLTTAPELAEQIDALVLATCTPDMPQPATAAIVQHELGLRPVPAFDINAVCSGFVYGLAVADGLCSGVTDIERVLVVGADELSSILDRTDRGGSVSRFGDGAGAVLLGPVPDEYGLLAVRMVTSGEPHRNARVPAGGTALPLVPRAHDAGEHLSTVDGRVRQYVDEVLGKTINQALDDAALRLDDVDRFILHQADTRMLEAFAHEMGIAPDRVSVTAPGLGNTGAASIPVTLHDSARKRPLRRGEYLVMASVGGGMTSGAAVMRWY